MIAVLALAWNQTPEAPPPASPPGILERIDRLYAQGPNAATEAMSLAEEAVGQTPESYDVVWRVSRAAFQLAESVPKPEKQTLLEGAIKAGQKAVTLLPERAEGHYWLGASYGELAAISGIFKSLSLVRSLRSEMEVVLRLDPDYEGGDTFRALAELDTQLPSLLGGSRSRAIARGEEGLRRHPQNLELRLTLAKAYLADGKRASAREQLETLVKWPVDPVRPLISSPTRAEASRLLEGIPAH